MIKFLYVILVRVFVFVQVSLRWDSFWWHWWD